MIGLKRGVVKLVSYQKSWSKEFNKEKVKLEKVLGKNAVSIKHCGSTSIPGMKSKPIIDVYVGVKTVKREGKKCERILDKLPGYYPRNATFPKRDRFVIAKGNETKRTHYIHVVRYKGTVWNKTLFFRDYLRKNKGASKKYSDLKQQLFRKHSQDRRIYTGNKSKFVKSILNKMK